MYINIIWIKGILIGAHFIPNLKDEGMFLDGRRRQTQTSRGGRRDSQAAGI
jgi:hypothetical protein